MLVADSASRVATGRVGKRLAYASGSSIEMGMGDRLARHILLGKLAKHPAMSSSAALPLPDAMAALSRREAVKMWAEARPGDVADQWMPNASRRPPPVPMAGAAALAPADARTVKSVNVAVRVRPFNERELRMGAELVVSMHGSSVALENLHPSHGLASSQGRRADDERERSHTFTYTHALWSFSEEGDTPFATQETVYRDLGAPILEKAMEGYSCCLFAYGQTGAGKSFSVTGTAEEKGIVPRVRPTHARRDRAPPVPAPAAGFAGPRGGHGVCAWSVRMECAHGGMCAWSVGMECAHGGMCAWSVRMECAHGMCAWWNVRMECAHGVWHGVWHGMCAGAVCAGRANGVDGWAPPARALYAWMRRRSTRRRLRACRMHSSVRTSST